MSGIQAWGNESIVLLSQGFANWRLGVDSNAGRWALLPELYGQYCKTHNGSFPRGYYKRSDLISLKAKCVQTV